MIMTKKYMVILCLILVSFSLGFSQFTNLGKEFYFCYPANASRDFGAGLDPSFFDGMLILTSSFDASGVVKNHDGSVSLPFNIAANSVDTVFIDSSNWIVPSETIQERGWR